MLRLLMIQLEIHFVSASTLQEDVKAGLREDYNVEAAAKLGTVIAKESIR